MSKNETLDDKDILLQLSKDFHDLVTNKEELRASVENFLDNTIDEIALGIIFDLHRKYKTSDYEIEEEDGEDEDNEEIDIFAQQDLKKTQKCVCSICDRAVAATRFAQHLEACMGMRRNRFRNATRSVASSNNKDRENSSFSSVLSDDEDDIDWNSGNKRGKKKKRSNGNNNKKPKGGGTPKKNATSNNKPNEQATAIEIEADDDELLREMFQVDHSNSSSPADSVSSTHSNSSKKKDKAKSKKNKRDRTSPNSSISAE